MGNTKYAGDPDVSKIRKLRNQQIATKSESRKERDEIIEMPLNNVLKMNEIPATHDVRNDTLNEKPTMNKISSKDKGHMKKKFSKMAEHYAEGLTVHGLSKALTGNSVFERIFWAFALLVALAVAIFMVKTLFMKFWNREVYIDSSTVKASKQHFPAVTFCLNEYRKSLFCNNHIDRLLVMTPNDIECNIKEDKIYRKEGYSMSTGSMQIWLPGTTNTFKVGCSAHMDCLMKDISNKFLKVNDEDPLNCITWNWNGTFYNTKSKVELSLNIIDNSLEDCYIYVHDYKESPLSVDYYIKSNVFQNIDLIFEKKKVQRLQRAPPKNCVSGKSESDKSIFPGKYTVTGCLDTIVCKQVLKLCGGTLDFCLKYMPESMINKYSLVGNKTYREIHRCIRRHSNKGTFEIKDVDVCPPPCEKTKFKITPSSSTTRRSIRSFTVRLMFDERNQYKSEVEKEIYSWEDLLSGVGGMIGLFCGFSLLSIIEIIVFVGLKLFTKRTVDEKNTDEK